MKNKFYAYLVPGGPSGVAQSWPECERKVKSVPNARYRGFGTRAEAEMWLREGARYESRPPRPPAPRPRLKPGIYFDAGTGRGLGVEVSVTDEKGSDLLNAILPKSKVNRFGKSPAPKNATNNFGELMAAKYALAIAKKKGIRNVYGDSRLVLDFWSKGLTTKKIPGATRRLASEVAKLREEFEARGGKMEFVPGGHNPADLGFH